MAAKQKDHLALDPHRYPPPLHCIDQDDMMARLESQDKTIRYDAKRNPCCGFCWEPRNDGHPLPLECDGPCGACGQSDHNGFYCPRLYLSGRCWRRIYNVTSPPEYVQVKPTEGEVHILVQCGYLDNDMNWLVDRPLPRNPTINPPLAHQPRPEQSISDSGPRPGYTRGGRAPSRGGSQRYSPYARPSLHSSQQHTRSPRNSSSPYPPRSQQPPSLQPRSHLGHASQVGYPPHGSQMPFVLPSPYLAAPSPHVARNAPPSVSLPGRPAPVAADDKERLDELVDKAAANTLATVRVALEAGRTWEEVTAMVTAGYQSEKFRSAYATKMANVAPERVESNQYLEEMRKTWSANKSNPSHQIAVWPLAHAPREPDKKSSESTPSTTAAPVPAPTTVNANTVAQALLERMRASAEAAKKA